MNTTSETARAAPLILLVDDDPAVLRRLSRPLRKAGFRVMTACDGLGALERAAAERPDFVLLDVLMPHIDGFEVLKIWKSDPRSASIPVAMLEGMPADIADHQAINGPGKRWSSLDVEFSVIKPLLKDSAELVEAIRMWFKKHRRQETEV